MKKILSLVLSIFTLFSFAQTTTYKYYLYLKDYKNAHKFIKSNGVMVYNGKSSSEIDFFSNYTILEFKQAFEDGIDSDVLNVFYVETSNSFFVDDLKSRFPSIYLNSDDLTNWKIELLDYYPNDYGNTSPVTNLGFDTSRKELDYLHVPKAWDITTGNPNIKIGISDTPIWYIDPDFLGKVTPIPGYNQTLYQNSHGTGVAALAAARGNNSYGGVGVCMNCDIVEAGMGIVNYPNPETIYSNLYEMAKAGAKVINMSWTNSGYTVQGNNWITAEQLVINDLVNNYRVTLVAAAGNNPSFSTPESHRTTSTGSPLTPFGVIYCFPACYNNVISVSSIHHTNSYTLPLNTSLSSYCCTSPSFPIYLQFEDSVSHSISGLDPYNPLAVIRNGYYLTPQNPDGFQTGHTLNEKVDLLAPGYHIYNHGNIISNPENPFIRSGTSFAAPLVSGTIGLMLSVNDCLNPSEIEDILQLTAKDVENTYLNSQYTPINQTIYPNVPGYLGAGKLETGNAVEFVNEMKKVDGNAIIDNHIFNRFEFELNKINNNLTIQNVTFKDNCRASLTAKNQIKLLPGTNLLPNLNGETHLSINPNVDIACRPIVFNKSSSVETKNNEDLNSSNIVLYPNPNNGIFNLYDINFNHFNSSILQVNVFDANGRKLFESNISKNDSYSFDLQNLSTGIYIVKVFSNSKSQEIKFIKQ